MHNSYAYIFNIGILHDMTSLATFGEQENSLPSCCPDMRLPPAGCWWPLYLMPFARRMSHDVIG